MKILEFDMQVSLTAFATFATFTAFSTAGTITGQGLNEYENYNKYYYRNKIKISIGLALYG